MFNKFFNIGTTFEPVLVQENTIISYPSKMQKSKKASPIKIDAQKLIHNLLDDLQNVNNPKVDVLRMLAVALENDGDISNLKAFCKQPIQRKKTVKKFKY